MLVVINSTFFSNNASNEGAGIDTSSGNATVINSTFLGNTAGAGGAIAGVATLRGTILAGGLGGNCTSTQTDFGYNISDDASCGFNAMGSQNNTDPQLSPAGLSDNGGPTRTIALLSGSPAIDAIPVNSCFDQMEMPLKIDQRGFPRPDAGEVMCDIGAYEFQELFARQPGKPNCFVKSTTALRDQYETLSDAASVLDFRNVKALRKAIRRFCKST